MDIHSPRALGRTHGSAGNASETGKRMIEAGSTLLASFSTAQRSKALFPAASEERMQWDYRPGERIGVPLKEMDGSQQKLALALLASGLSPDGFAKTLKIMSHEKILGQLEGAGGRHLRDPDLYYVAFFGTPSDESAWAWRIEGHHLSVNFFITNDSKIAPTPHFMGVNPARVFKGPHAGLRILRAEEDMARMLLTSFDAKQIVRAVVDSEAPADIITRWEPRAKPEAPLGLPLQEMTADQGQSLMDLVSLYVNRMPDEVADIQMNRIEKGGRGYIHFAWAGSAVTGEPHYYRVHGPSFLVEYDNTQNNANHIHTVWRDFTNDWGDDLLESHYVDSHTQS